MVLSRHGALRGRARRAAGGRSAPALRLRPLQDTHPPPRPERRAGRRAPGLMHCELVIDRKSTRLNSSHLVISYAVFCLKKKTSKTLTVTARVVAGRLLGLLALSARTVVYWRRAI